MNDIELRSHRKLIAEARAEERERCAKIAEERARVWRDQRDTLCDRKATEAEAIATEIRNEI